MAIVNNDATFLFYAKSLEVCYKNTLTLGRLNLYATKDHIAGCLNKYDPGKSIVDLDFPDGYSEPLFKLLGAETTDSIDFSDYENASIIHDLNTPLPKEYYNSFDCIVDGGTLEHVFNFPAAIKNCMQAIKIGGHYIGVSPANNQLGHGFYQFSPELYFRIFSEENGFIIKKMLVTTATAEVNTSWYEVVDPKEANSRVMIVNSTPLSLMVIAKKVEEKEIFKKPPQQNDYLNTWAAHRAITKNEKPENVSGLKFLYKKMVPKKIKNILRNVYNIIKEEKIKTSDLGLINTAHLKEVEI
jgi:hypothetical protein